MNKSQTWCSIFGCGSRTRPIFRFPQMKRGEDLIRKWMEAAQNPRFEEMTKEQICRRGFVCHKHFRESDYRPRTSNDDKKRLKQSAVPSLNLPAKIKTYASQSIDAEVLSPSKTKCEEMQHSSPIKESPYYDSMMQVTPRKRVTPLKCTEISSTEPSLPSTSYEPDAEIAPIAGPSLPSTSYEPVEEFVIGQEKRRPAFEHSDLKKGGIPKEGIVRKQRHKLIFN